MRKNMQKLSEIAFTDVKNVTFYQRRNEKTLKSVNMYVELIPPVTRWRPNSLTHSTFKK